MSAPPRATVCLIIEMEGPDLLKREVDVTEGVCVHEIVISAAASSFWTRAISEGNDETEH